MNRRESDREDLLAEATALVERAELQLPQIDEPVVIGFRRHGAGCIYIGAEPVFQFNAASELRRGFLDGKLLRAENGSLVQLRRERTASETFLMRSTLTAERTEEVLQLAVDYLDRIGDALRNTTYQIVGQVPEDADVVARIAIWINQIPRPPKIADRANVGA